MSKKYIFRVCMNFEKTFSVMVQNFTVQENMTPDLPVHVPPIDLSIAGVWDQQIYEVENPIIADLATLNYYTSDVLNSMGSCTLQDVEFKTCL